MSFLSTFWLANVLLATAACKYTTAHLPKMLRRWGVLYILTWRCASRHSGVPFLDISTSKSERGPSFFPNSFSYGVFANIGSGAVPGRLLGGRFQEVPGRFRGRFRTTRSGKVPGRVPGHGSGKVPRQGASGAGGSGQSPRAVFRDNLRCGFLIIFPLMRPQNWKKTCAQIFFACIVPQTLLGITPGLIFLAFWLANALRTTAACNFYTSHLPKMARSWSVLYILT